MGLRFRKSINLGGFRINISKSGIGYSFGVPGMRYTKKAKGGTRTTLSIPGTGLSYIKDSKQTSINNKPSNNECNYSHKHEDIYSEITDSSPHQLIDKMNETTKKNQFLLTIKIFCGIIAFIGFAFFYGGVTGTYHIAIGIVGLIVLLGTLISLLFIPKSALIELNYTFDNSESEASFNELLSAIENLKDSERIYEIDYANVHNDWKNHAGAQASINRKNIKIADVKLFKSKYNIQSINVQDKKIIFLPDIIAIMQNGKWFAIKWQQFKLAIDTTIFMETERIPSDVIILGYTYLHPNKDGSPDKRYANNPKIAKCQYSIVGFETTNGLDVVLMISNQNIAQALYNALNKFKN